MTPEKNGNSMSSETTKIKTLQQIREERKREMSKEEIASFHYDIGELHKKVGTLEAKIFQIAKDICKIKEVIDNFHSNCEYSQFDEE